MCEVAGDRFAGVFSVDDFGDFFWGVVAEESSKNNFFSIGYAIVLPEYRIFST